MNYTIHYIYSQMSRLSAKLKLAAKIIKENGYKEWQCCAQSGD